MAIAALSLVLTSVYLPVNVSAEPSAPENVDVESITLETEVEELQIAEARLFSRLAISSLLMQEKYYRL